MPICPVLAHGQLYSVNFSCASLYGAYQSQKEKRPCPSKIISKPPMPFSFPGTKFEVLHTIAQGDYVVTNWKASGGTHSGPLLTPSGGTVPPTGKSATIMGSTTAQLKNGKVIHSWTFWDMASLLGQLGLLPPM